MINILCLDKWVQFSGGNNHAILIFGSVFLVGWLVVMGLAAL